MAFYQYKYIITSERVAYIESDDIESAKDKVEQIMTENSEIGAIKKIEQGYIKTLADTHLGVDFGSFCNVPLGIIESEDDLE